MLRLLVLRGSLVPLVIFFLEQFVKGRKALYFVRNLDDFFKFIRDFLDVKSVDKISRFRVCHIEALHFLGAKDVFL